MITVEWKDNLDELYPGKPLARLNDTEALVFNTKAEYFKYIDDNYPSEETEEPTPEP